MYMSGITIKFRKRIAKMGPRMIITIPHNNFPDIEVGDLFDITLELVVVED